MKPKDDVSDDESLLTPEQRRIIAECLKQTSRFSRNQKPPEGKAEKPEGREEKLSWLARKKPGIQNRIRRAVNTLFFDPKRQKP